MGLCLMGEIVGFGTQPDVWEGCHGWNNKYNDKGELVNVS